MKSHFYILNCSSLSCEPNSCKKKTRYFCQTLTSIKKVTELELEKIQIDSS